jgi:hypothetical protein
MDEILGSLGYILQGSLGVKLLYIYTIKNPLRTLI